MPKSKILLLGFLFTSASLLTLGCEEETDGTTSSSSSSSSSGDTSSSSSSGMGGSGGGGMTAVQKYCADITTNCTGTNQQWPDAKSCENAAASFAPGMDTDTKGNTLGCRTYHTGAAMAAPDMHCVHAGPAGGGAAFCGDTCEGFCDIAVNTCKTEWPDKTACLAACAAIPTAVQNYNTSIASGNTIECRLYHLSVAATDAASATTHCPHTKAVTVTGDPCF